jgi:hypothetical protein
MKYTPEDFIKYTLEKDPDLMQAFSERKLADVLSEPLDCGKITLDYKILNDDYGTPIDIYKFEYNKGRYLYFDVDEFDAWYLQKKRDYLLEDLGV